MRAQVSLARMQSRGEGEGYFWLQRRAGDVVPRSWRRCLAGAWLLGCGWAGQAVAELCWRAGLRVWSRGWSGSEREKA